MHSAGPVPYVFPALLVAVSGSPAGDNSRHVHGVLLGIRSELCWVRTMQKAGQTMPSGGLCVVSFFLHLRIGAG